MLVIVSIVVIDVRSIVCLDVVGIVCKVVGSTGVVFAVILGRMATGGQSMEVKENGWSYAHVTLNDVMDVAGAILIQLYVMTWAFLWRAAFEDEGWGRGRGTDRI